jgi:L-seryl-tRNA(Ser) seleniumtransferase
LTTQQDPSRLRGLPAIDRLLAGAGDLVDRYGRAAVTGALRAAVDHARGAALAGDAVPTAADLIAAAAAALAARWPPPPRPVINATGVVVHTNLGRAPLAPAARDAMIAASGYCDLEYDLPTGGRGSRSARLEPLLCDATGAQAAFAVNNAAAALVLALACMAHSRDVLVSRGELIEIGGSFRLPDIMEASGARLLEVGTTNRTRAGDYFAGDDPAAILSLHPSNYRIVGFVAQPSIAELAAVGAKRRIPLIYDVGSGLLQRTGGALAGEPAIASALQDGADLVLCSGDKLLGGPQAGLLFGRRDLIAACRSHPLARALRLDKLRIAALHATLELHLRDRAHEVPVWHMLTADTASLQVRCRQLAERLSEAGLAADVTVAAGVPGGGSAPDAHLPGPVVRLLVEHPTELATLLRGSDPPIVVRVTDGSVIVDLRTVAPADDERLVATLARRSRRHPASARSSAPAEGLEVERQRGD